MYYGKLTLPELKQKEADLQRALDSGKGNRKEIERHLRLVRARIKVYNRAFYG